MDKPLEKLWVSLVDSAQFRRFSGKGIGRHFFHSNVYRSLRFTKNSLSSSFATLTQPTLFEDVKTLCLFVGHNKSGTSMLGSLLDAHPNIILSDEVGVLDYVSAGFNRDQIFHMLLRGSRRELMKGRITARRLTPYSYLVPGQWQGRFEKLQVIGDGKAGTSTRQFARDPQLLSQLLSVMKDVDVKLIQVVRNPFDVISVMMVRGKRTFANSINHYFTNCENIVRLREHMRTNLLAVHYEDFVTYPEANLIRICEYLDVEPHPEYLRACAGIMHETPDRSRDMVEWTPKWIKVVERNLDKYYFLQGYNFES